MSTDLIVIDYAAQTATTPDQAIALRDAALEGSALISRVSNAAEQSVAVAAQSALDNLARDVEKARKKLKEPVIELGRKIDKAAKDFIAEVETERARLGKLNGDYTALELAKVRAAEAARQLEIERQERERREAEEKIRREAAEAQRKIDEAQREAMRKAQEAKTAEARANAEAERLEFERLRKAQEAKTLAELDAANEAHSRAVAELPKVELKRAEGQRVTEDWDITVTDVHLLAKCHPNCVKIEPRILDIKDLLNLGQTVRGITAKKVVKVGTSSRGGAVINV